MNKCRWCIHLCVLMGIMYAASDRADLSPGALEEAMGRILLEQVDEAKGKYDTYPVQFVLYKNTAKSRQRIISTLTEQGKIHKGQFNASASIKILVHGWKHRMKKSFEPEFMRAFNGTIRNVQVIAIRWREADRDYIGARRAVPGVARQIQLYVQRLEKDYNVRPQRLAFFGHGLGAQICGAVGHLLKGRLGKIIAMDPAMPLFWQNTHDSVNRSSALRVIGVHTCAGTFGVIWNVGHSDFWALNGMAPQKPWCNRKTIPEDILRCSHEQAYKYFIETIKYRYSIRAVTCGKRYICKPKVFKKQKVLLTEYNVVRGQFCFKPPKWHPWPKLPEILEKRNQTDLPPLLNETTTDPSGMTVTVDPSHPDYTLPPGVTLPPGMTLPPGETLSPGGTLPPLTLPPGVTLAPGVTAPPGFTLPPGMTLPPGVTMAPGGTLPPGLTLPPGMTLPPIGTLAPGQIETFPPNMTLPPGVTLPPEATTARQRTTTPDDLSLDDCDAMIRMHRKIISSSPSDGGRGLSRGNNARLRKLRAKIKECEDFKARMKRISHHKRGLRKQSPRKRRLHKRVKRTHK